MKTKQNFRIIVLGSVLITLASCGKEELTTQDDNLDNALSNATLKSSGECTSAYGLIKWGSHGKLSGQAGSSTAAVYFVDRSYVFYKGKSTDKIYYTTNIGLVNEAEWSIGTGETTHEPAVAYHEGPLYVAYKGKSTNKIYYKHSTYFDVSTGRIYWSSEYCLSKPRTSSGPALCSLNGKLYFFYKGESTKNIYWCTLDNHTTEQKVPNGVETGYSPAATTDGTQIYLLYKGAIEGSSMYMSRANISGESLTWLPEQRFANEYDNCGSSGINYIKDKIFLSVYISDLKIGYKYGLDDSFSKYNILYHPWNSGGVSEIILEPNISCTNVIVFYVRNCDKNVAYSRGYLIMNN